MERWTYDAPGAPITIGTVTIHSGDYLIADMDGAVVIPQEIAEAAVTQTEKVMAEESDMRKAILDGMDPEQAYLKYNRFLKTVSRGRQPKPPVSPAAKWSYGCRPDA